MDRPLGPRGQPPERHAAYEDIFGRRPATHPPPPQGQRPPQAQYHPQAYQQQQQYHPQQYQQYAPAPPPQYAYPGPAPARGPYQQQGGGYYGGSTASLRAPSVRSMHPPPGAAAAYAPHPGQHPNAQHAHGHQQQHPQYPHGQHLGAGLGAGAVAPPPAAYPPAADAQGLTPAQAYQAQVAQRAPAPPSLSLSLDINDTQEGGRLGIDFEGEGGWGTNGNGVNGHGVGVGGGIAEGEEGEEDEDEESELPWARGHRSRDPHAGTHPITFSSSHPPRASPCLALMPPDVMISLPHLGCTCSLQPSRLASASAHIGLPPIGALALRGCIRGAAGGAVDDVPAASLRSRDGHSRTRRMFATSGRLDPLNPTLASLRLSPLVVTFRTI
ncbi:hypothetical protein C8F04DRAFT_1263594 [Mycena alexandri]|uniref:Uncharacterized protein n=1 Tax=Mycena alexandri TaxID=1745969 RepID=A0AAD6SMJ0_9AGAR|nr:hypothetical protein C8F04DRAFT_1263594 [Mycena alexandri]